MLLVRTHIGPSPIHGLGVFADEDITEGQHVWRFTHGYDLELTIDQFESLPEHVREFVAHYGYLDFHLNHYLLCFDHARFINHSNHPNICTDHTVDPHGIDIAVRPIKTGEEITTDYRLFERNSSFSIVPAGDARKS